MGIQKVDPPSYRLRRDLFLWRPLTYPMLGQPLEVHCPWRPAASRGQLPVDGAQKMSPPPFWKANDSRCRERAAGAGGGKSGGCSILRPVSTWEGCLGPPLPRSGPPLSDQVAQSAELNPRPCAHNGFNCLCCTLFEGALGRGGCSQRSS